MPRLLIRSAAAAVFVLAIYAPALAQQESALPSIVQSIMKSMRIENPTSLVYQDKAGTPISADEFAKLVGAGETFEIRKSMVNGAPAEVTLKFADKNAVKGPAPSAKIKPGEPFPPFRMARLDGTVVDNKALEGRYTLVSFYFADCVPCVKEVPDLNALAQSRKDINLLAITYDSAEVSRKFVDATKLGWPIIPDAKKLIGEVGVPIYPTIALLDPKGKVVEIKFGGAIGYTGRFDAWLNKKIKGS